ncbi:hypothetical protein NPIL_171231 [Nephila pilipes]|uniref:Uncharacterized protein n=1 Tax=Nephila pilipes TaxID=299642 RepID=A0A8X6Q8S0_NEPPI|nr:hypothetical protein NPIL_171231 [Nephila pilipes]
MRIKSLVSSSLKELGTPLRKAVEFPLSSSKVALPSQLCQNDKAAKSAAYIQTIRRSSFEDCNSLRIVFKNVLPLSFDSKR